MAFRENVFDRVVNVQWSLYGWIIAVTAGSAPQPNDTIIRGAVTPAQAALLHGGSAFSLRMLSSAGDLSFNDFLGSDTLIDTREKRRDFFKQNLTFMLLTGFYSTLFPGTLLSVSYVTGFGVQRYFAENPTQTLAFATFVDFDDTREISRPLSTAKLVASGASNLLDFSSE